MRTLSASMLTILEIFSHSFCFNLKCVNLPPLGGDFVDNSGQCLVSGLVIISPDNAITSVNGDTDPSSYTELIIHNQTVNFLPQNIAAFFPQLEALEISNSSLEWIEQADIVELTSLLYLNLEYNDLEILEEGLFDFNTQLVTVIIRNNRLKFVHKDIFYKLLELITIDLEQNLCTKLIYDDYYDSSNFKERAHYYKPLVQDKLNRYCQSWNDAFSIQAKMSRKKMNILLAEKKKLAHRLSACDGNLDAALTNFHQSKSSNITDKPNELPLIDLMCSHEKCFAHSFKVSFANSPIEGSFFNTTSSLQVYQQQTLFLPLNLAAHFPFLKELSITESGLCEIDYNVLEGLDLFTLNLTGNKIPDIPSKTFAGLNKLQVLDLSFNKIRHLFGDVFANLKSLKQLYLNNNHLTSIQNEVVNSLESLVGLFLQGNRLKFISATLLTQLTSLKSVDLSSNVCIDMSHPESDLVDIEGMIIDNCIAPVELICKLDGRENERHGSYCNVEGLFIDYAKTKISKLRNEEQGLNESVKIFFADKQSIRFFPFQLSQQFPNLGRIEIQQSNLTALHRLDFDGFSKLTEIVINKNNLSSIGGGTFDTVPQLELLDLSSNNIITLPADIFARLTRLDTLILSDNQIVKFKADFISRKNVIVEFRANNNRLEFIETKAISFLRRAELIDLTGNVCIDLKFSKTENQAQALIVLSGEVVLNCLADD